MLRQCVASLLALPLSPEEREIIVVDDGSDASPADALAGMSSEIRYIYQHNQGLSVARNNGIDAAKGEYIQFVDSDDCLLPAYSDCIEYVRKSEHDVIMFRFTHSIGNINDCDINDIQGKEKLNINDTQGKEKANINDTQGTAKPNMTEFEGPARQYLTDYNLRGAACCYCFRKEILGDLRFMPGIYHEDELFTPQLLARAGSMISLLSSAYFYRQHEGSIIHSRNEQKVRKRLDDAEFVITTLSTTHNSDPQSPLARRIHQLTMDYIYNIVRETHSISEYRTRSKRLRTAAIYPIPVRNYTLKYLLFSILTRLA